MKPGVSKYSKNSILIDFYFRGVRCREWIQLEPNDKNLRFVAKLKGRIEHEIATKTFDYKEHFPKSRRAKLFEKFVSGSEKKIKPFLEEWLAQEKQHVRHSTYIGYQKIIKYHLAEAFGDLFLADLKRKHVWDWADKETEMSSKRMRNVLSVFRVALNHAVEREIIETNPLVGLKVRKRKNASREDGIDPFSSEERNAILSALDGQNQNLVQFWFWTGMRTSELVALDWTDIDWRRGVVVITKSLTQGMNEPEKATKTAAGRREVRLLQPALDALQAQKQHTYIQNAEIFQNPRTGKRWTGDWVIREKMWKSALKKAKVRYREPYQCRHTFASMCLTAGENPLWLSKQMGHTNPDITLKHYARFISDDAPQAGNLVVDKFSKRSVYGQSLR